MNSLATYPKFPDMNRLVGRLLEYGRLKVECGTPLAEIEAVLRRTELALEGAVNTLRSLPEDETLSEAEPDSLEEIQRMRPGVSKSLWTTFHVDKYRDRLAGAFLGRMAGCTLGAPVEFWTTETMRDWAAYSGDAFPPVDYWSASKTPNDLRYGVSPYAAYTRSVMDGVPVDDDVTYTLLGLLVLEEFGPHFTVDDVGQAWLKYLPYACTAEEVALDNLKAGISPLEAAAHDNPFVQWIGADIRSDPWGYAAPGLPELAATMAWTDAWLSHRRNGIYGEMFFSAAIAAAFAVDDPVEALRIGLNEIPPSSLLAGDVRWALEAGRGMKDHLDARAAVADRFAGMSGVHTNLNACLTIFGLMIGGDDFTRCIGETVAMGYDNDCTAATAGSLFGAAKGVVAIPSHWYEPFNDKVMTYLTGHPLFSIEDVKVRFETIARKVHNVRG